MIHFNFEEPEEPKASTSRGIREILTISDDDDENDDNKNKEETKDDLPKQVEDIVHNGNNIFEQVLVQFVLEHQQNCGWQGNGIFLFFTSLFFRNN